MPSIYHTRYGDCDGNMAASTSTADGHHRAVLHAEGSPGSEYTSRSYSCRLTSWLGETLRARELASSLPDSEASDRVPNRARASQPSHPSAAQAPAPVSCSPPG